MSYHIPRKKPGPEGKVAIRARLVEEYRQTGASIHSLARKYGVGNGTAWGWVHGQRSELGWFSDRAHPPEGLGERLEPLLRPEGVWALRGYKKQAILQDIFLVLREGRPWKQTLPGYLPGRTA